MLPMKPHSVETILAEISEKGDAAVRNYSVKFDNWSPQNFRMTEAGDD